MATSAAQPIPKLVSPPGPSANALRVLPDAQISINPSSSSLPPTQLLHDAITVRAEVYVAEQKCSAAEEIDVDDEVSWHWVIHASDVNGSGVPAATVRLVPAQAHADADDGKAVDGPDYKGSKMWDHKEPYAKIGRLATVKAFRGRGYGRVLVLTALEYAGRHGGVMVKDEGMGQWKGLVLAHAQINVEGWYKGLGFKRDEGMGVWWEEGIEHVGMWKRVDAANY